MGLAFENAHLGDNAFPQKTHRCKHISERLLDARIDFDVWPKDVEGRIPKSEVPLRCDKLAYIRMELPLDRPLLTSDCWNDVSTGAEKDNLGVGIIVRVTI